ncbi:MAG: DUF167 domain-containing protein [Candidatus Entotheonellia bacterium]
MLDLRQSGADVLLPVSVQPRASRNAVAGLYGDALKLQLTAPPVEGAANDACLRLLAELLGVNRARLYIVKGARSRQKTIRIANASIQQLRERLEALLTTG